MGESKRRKQQDPAYGKQDKWQVGKGGLKYADADKYLMEFAVKNKFQGTVSFLLHKNVLFANDHGALKRLVPFFVASQFQENEGARLVIQSAIKDLHKESNGYWMYYSPAPSESSQDFLPEPGWYRSRKMYDKVLSYPGAILVDKRKIEVLTKKSLISRMLYLAGNVDTYEMYEDLTNLNLLKKIECGFTSSCFGAILKGLELDELQFLGAFAQIKTWEWHRPVETKERIDWVLKTLKKEVPIFYGQLVASGDVPDVTV